MEKNKSTGSNITRIAIVILAIIFFLSAVLFAISMWEKRHGTYPDLGDVGLSSTLEYEGEEYMLKDNIETFLVLGLDKFEGSISNDSYNNDRQADFMILFVFNNDDKTCSAIHINRDSMVEINVLGVAGEKIGTVKKQIALSHTYGAGNEVSCRNAADAVSKLLMNTKINHYISVTMDAVPAFNDFVGGVEVTVLDDFTGTDNSLVKGENVTLNGQQALTYVRSRYGLDDSTNSNRMKRQRQYLEALYSKTLASAEKSEDFIVEASLLISDYIVSDCTVNRLQMLFEKFISYDFTEITYLEGETKMGEKYIEFYPAEESVKKVVIDSFYKVKEDN